MSRLRSTFVSMLVAIGCATAQAQRSNDAPLTIRSQGSFFVVGEIMVNQMYVQYAALSRIPTLMVFGDHLGDVQTGGLVNWQTAHDSCLALVDKMKAAGGDAQMMHLPSLGIKGNSHMLMQDKNSDQIADLIIDWLDEHVERR